MKSKAAALAVLIASMPAPCAADGFGALARELGRAAAAAGIRSLAVLPFAPGDASPPKEGVNIADKLLTRIVRGGKVQAVERSMLRRIVEEHHLARTGIPDAGLIKQIGEIVPVGAVITGSFVNSGEETVLQARLINVKTGIILAAAERRVDREQFGLQALEAASDNRTASLWMPVPELTVPAPELPADGSPEAGASAGGGSCANASERIDALEAQILDVKARYWAGQIRKGVSLSRLTVNPGSEISDPELKKSFYGRLQYWYETASIPELTPSDLSRFVRIDREALALYGECGA